MSSNACVHQHILVVRLAGTLRGGSNKTGPIKVTGLREGNGRHLDVKMDVELYRC